ncbi:MAG: hypothetical protein COA73_02110 [Candidatus Hydrogenedentota bacterium]|nr:MAG: hypothetical protein COA73_02110 [Candidatus Hydrogenedentota bacterium]
MGDLLFFWQPAIIEAPAVCAVIMVEAFADVLASMDRRDTHSRKTQKHAATRHYLQEFLSTN